MKLRQAKKIVKQWERTIPRYLNPWFAARTGELPWKIPSFLSAQRRLAHSERRRLPWHCFYVYVDGSGVDDRSRITSEGFEMHKSWLSVAHSYGTLPDVIPLREPFAQIA